MIPLIVLKILGDLSFYYAFAGFFAHLNHVPANTMLLTIALQAAVYTLSYLLENKGNLRFAVLPLSLLGLFLPGLCPAYVLLQLPPTAYLILCAKNRTYFPTWSGAVDLVSLFWKLLAPFTLLGIVTRCTDTMVAITFPCAVITFTSCIMLARSLRHDSDIYSSPLYQAMNIGTAGALLAGTLLVSTPGFRQAAGSVIKFLYMNTLMPLLLWTTQIFAYLMVGAVTLFLKLLRMLQVNGDEVPDYDTIYGTPTDNTLYSDYDPNAHPYLKAFAIAVLVAAALYGAYKLFCRLKGMQTRKTPDDTGEKESRSYVFSSSARAKTDENGMAEKLRAQYRRFLKLYLKHNFPLERFFTSENICQVSAKAFDQEASQKLRSLYIRARYDGKAEKEDVALAKELIHRLKKDADI